MTAMRPVLDVIIDANVVFLLTFGLWALAQLFVSRSRMATDYAAQLKMLRMVMICVVLSPFLAAGVVWGSQMLWPKTPITVSDLAVAAYLRGEIAIPAVEFEAILDTRSRILDAVIAGEYPWLLALGVMIAIGGLVQALRTTITIFHVRHLLKGSYVWRQTRTTDIRLSDTVTMPFAARGVFRRHVVLPSALVTDTEALRVVLAHEFQHLRQGDVEWEVGFELLRPFLYWNPVYLLWKRAFDRLRELSCDQTVVTKRRISARDYANCLIAFCEKRLPGPAPRAMNVAFLRRGRGAAKFALETRIRALEVVPEHGESRAAQIAMIAVMSIGIVLAAASVRPPGDWSQDSLTFSMIVNLERYNANYSGF